MIPKNALKKIRSVTIFYLNRICGFSFFDKDGALLWKHGSTSVLLHTGTVLFEENEVILGVVAKLYPGYQNIYTDF